MRSSTCEPHRNTVGSSFWTWLYCEILPDMLRNLQLLRVKFYRILLVWLKMLCQVGRCLISFFYESSYLRGAMSMAKNPPSSQLLGSWRIAAERKWRTSHWPEGSMPATSDWLSLLAQTSRERCEQSCNGPYQPGKIPVDWIHFGSQDYGDASHTLWIIWIFLSHHWGTSHYPLVMSK